MTQSIDLPTRRSTTRLAARLAPLLEAGDLLILSGELGAGKTFFTRALCRALGLSSRIRVTSPTFALVNEHATRPPMLHADLYRLEQAREVQELGLLERRDEGQLVVVEWGAPWVEHLGGDAVMLEFSTDPRKVVLSSTGPRSQQILIRLTQASP